MAFENRRYTGKALTHVGRYEILEELGRGAMGVVYKALDPTIGRTVAIKAIRLTEYQDSDERERIHQRLWREARSAGVLSHPNIVTIYDVVEQDSAAFIVMECVNGQSLAQLFRRGVLPPRTELLRYLRQVAGALDYAHQKGVVHRDVKPGNIMISQVVSESQGLAKVADFGVAKFISQETTHSGTMIGTPSYLSPEQIEGSVSDGRSDQFSLAVVMYELLTGQKPFDSENLSALFYQICKQSPKAADQLNPLLSSVAGKVLARGLAKEPDQRFTTCSELVSALDASLETQHIMTRQEASAPVQLIEEVSPVRVRRHRLQEDSSTTRRNATSRVILIAALVTLLTGVGVALYLLRSRSPVMTTQTPIPTPSAEALKPAAGVNRAGRKTTRAVPTRTAAEQAPAAPQNPMSKSTLPVPVPLVPVLSTVMFRVEPGGAKIQVDGRPETECVSPCTIRLSNGRHTMVATSAGFTDARRIFNVPGETDLPIVLVRSMGLLLMTSEPSGSSVMVDGKASGQTPVTLHLPAGPHQVLLTNGTQRHEETVMVVADEFLSRSMRWQ